MRGVVGHRRLLQHVSMLTRWQPQAFQVIPAVDILGTEAVRLLRGDYDEVTLREADPFALIERGSPRRVRRSSTSST